MEGKIWRTLSGSIGRESDGAVKAVLRHERPPRGFAAEGSETWAGQKAGEISPSLNELLNAERTASRQRLARTAEGDMSELVGKGYIGAIDEQGIVSTVLYRTEMSDLVEGQEAMLRIMEHFGKNVRGLRGLWSGKGTNIDEINRLTGLGQNDEEAPWKTRTGQQARKFGFTKVRLDWEPRGVAGKYEQVRVVFE